MSTKKEKARARPKVDVMMGLSRLEVIPAKGTKIVSIYQAPNGHVFVWWEADRDG